MILAKNRAPLWFAAPTKKRAESMCGTPFASSGRSVKFCKEVAEFGQPMRVRVASLFTRCGAFSFSTDLAFA